jgi:hypothetical protein
MAIKINNVTAIDDSRNVSAAGIATVGSGNSTITVNGLTGIMNVGTGITMEGIPGNISIAGTLTAAGFNVPASIVSFSPVGGATSVALTTSIVITFSQAVGIATTGFLRLRTGTAGGPGIATFGVNELKTFLQNSKVLAIVPTPGLPSNLTIFPVIPSGLIKSTSGDFVGLNTTGAGTYSFTTGDPQLGNPYEGGYLICKASPLRWVVSPRSAEVSRTWYCVNDSNTVAQQVSGRTGWFVPTSTQLQNPGYCCRSFWGPSPCFSSTNYWSSTSTSPQNAISVNFTNGNATDSFQIKTCTCCVRSFRCVTY